MIRGVIEYRGAPSDVAKEIRPAAKEALAAAGSWWHRRILPGHFLVAAEKKYGYEPRSPAYTRYKAKRFGHRNPLVFRGDLRAAVVRQARITSTSKGARVALRGPRHLHAYRKDYNQPDKAAELTAVTRDEVAELAKFVDRRITRRLNAVQTRRRVG